MIASRTRSCMGRIGSSSTRGSRMRVPGPSSGEVRDVAYTIMDGRECEQFGRVCLGSRIAQKVTAADFWARQILQQVRLARRRVALDVEMKAAMVETIG